MRLRRYAEKIAEVMAKAPRGSKTSIHLETSEADPFRETNVALGAMLDEEGRGARAAWCSRGCTTRCSSGRRGRWRCCSGTIGGCA